MPLVKYRIYELSARAVISYGRQQDGNRGNFLSGRFTNKVNQFKFVSFTSGQLAPNFYN